MDIDGSSWENVQAPAVERISPPNGAAAATNGTRRASNRGKVVRRDITPTRAAAPVPPTTQKRKAAAANVDGESSELSSPPPEEEITARPAAKTPRTSANGRGGTTRSVKKTSADAVPASKTPATRKAPRRSGRGYRAPSDSEEDDEEFGQAGPSTARKAASPATTAPRRSTRNAQPPPNKAPRLR
ncbi:hypothetical protein M407DRAFT_20232 [Tulasnella calospora MUT 4182]|uniref:Uncharacterized protein n=1 Tax=Tulasnella calospora MUT 4182 TaxID=1051891 RepID=A0A0C3L9W5_9AGAM|nr:hypothetical protein M407DRAFT_20232 [Tulasnella calospora MUT 4182]